MSRDIHSNQIEVQAFLCPAPILAGSEAERFARHRARFARQRFDLVEENRRAGFAAFKVWHHRQRQNAAEDLAHIPPSWD